MEPLPPADLSSIKSELTPEEDEKLTGNMSKLYRMLLPNPESDVRKEKFLVKLENMLNQKWPGNSIKLRIFGSSGNKLCSSESDGKSSTFVLISLSFFFSLLFHGHSLFFLLLDFYLQGCTCRCAQNPDKSKIRSLVSKLCYMA